MNKRLKRRISIALGGFLAFMIGILLLCMIAEASTGSIYATSEGRYFSEEAGYFQMQGRTQAPTPPWKVRLAFVF